MIVAVPSTLNLVICSVFQLQFLPRHSYLVEFLLREANGSLGVELYFNGEDGFKDMSINEMLVQRGVLRVEKMKHMNHSNVQYTLMRPG